VSLPVTRPLIDHLALRVRDLKRSRMFYERALEPFGVTVVESSQGPGFAMEISGSGKGNPGRSRSCGLLRSRPSHC
jgi:catechol 2,3-dioxygenase-like lactoylglutathione lyase family enzyme